jgi:glycerophosphoryl diester phosphodiesterase
MPSSHLLLIAHRGESADAPENTLAAFRLAWERNVPTIELDVHLTKDGEAVICHDADTKRTAGTKLVIKDTPLADLRALDAGKWKAPRWAGEKLPTLAEALATSGRTSWPSSASRPRRSPSRSGSCRS